MNTNKSRIRMQSVIALFGALCVCATPGCRQAARQSSDSGEHTKLTLHSGQAITVTGVGSQKAPDGSVTLTVDYRSELSKAGYEAVAPEAVEVWSEFRPLAEAKGAGVAMVRAHQGSQRAQPLVFAFTKGADGSWQRPELRTLPSGKQVLVARVAKNDGQLFIDYVTHIPIRDVCALEPEVDDVWAAYRTSAERESISKVFVSPSEMPVGGGSISLSFIREPGGSWSKQRLCSRSAAE